MVFSHFTQKGVHLAHRSINWAVILDIKYPPRGFCCSRVSRDSLQNLTVWCLGLGSYLRPFSSAYPSCLKTNFHPAFHDPYRTAGPIHVKKRLTNSCWEAFLRLKVTQQQIWIHIWGHKCLNFDALFETRVSDFIFLLLDLFDVRESWYPNMGTEALPTCCSSSQSEERKREGLKACFSQWTEGLHWGQS